MLLIYMAATWILRAVFVGEILQVQTLAQVIFLAISSLLQIFKMLLALIFN